MAWPNSVTWLPLYPLHVGRGSYGLILQFDLNSYISQKMNYVLSSYHESLPPSLPQIGSVVVDLWCSFLLSRSKLNHTADCKWLSVFQFIVSYDNTDFHVYIGDVVCILACRVTLCSCFLPIFLPANFHYAKQLCKCGPVQLLYQIC